MKKRIIPALLVVLVLLATFLMGGCSEKVDDKPQDSPARTDSSNEPIGYVPEVNSPSPASNSSSADGSEAPVENSAKPAENTDKGTKLNIGDKAEIVPGVFMTVNSTRTSQGGDNIYMQPKDEYYNVSVTIQNDSDEEFIFADLFETKLTDGAEEEYMPSISSDETAVKLDSDIPAGESKTGDITFDISPAVTGLTFTYLEMFNMYPAVAWNLDR